jgi:RPA family protein
MTLSYDERNELVNLRREQAEWRREKQKAEHECNTLRQELERLKQASGQQAVAPNSHTEEAHAAIADFISAFRKVSNLKLPGV